MAEAPRRIVRCGLYMAAKKRPKFDGFVAEARTYGVEMLDLDLDAPAPAPVHVDAVVPLLVCVCACVCVCVCACVCVCFLLS